MRNYIICIAVTVAVMAAAIAVPSLFISNSQANSTAMGQTDIYTTEGDSLPYWEKIQAVGFYIAKADGYERNQINSHADDIDNASSQFFSIVEKLHLDNMISDDLYNNLATNDCAQSVTDYEYLLYSEPLLVVRVIDRTYHSATTADSISLSVGLDRDSGQIIYLYLNFFGDIDMNSLGIKDIDDDFINECTERWSAVIGIFGNADTNLEIELDEDNKMRFLAEYHINGSVILQYQIGMSYNKSEDRHQFFISPKAS